MRSSNFQAWNASNYERSMGRWSRRLAPLLIAFGGLAEEERVLDVGCGTGSLTFALPEHARLGAVTGLDYEAIFVEHARAKNTDPRLSFQQGDACALPFADGAFDRAYSMLVLQFVRDGAKAAAEMRRVVRPGGTVCAAVWDAYGGMLHSRIMWNIAAVLHPEAPQPHALLRGLDGPSELAALWQSLGLVQVEQTSLLIRMDFESFDDYWHPFTTGEGPTGHFVANLGATDRETLTGHVRRAYLANRPDGARSFVAVAWAVRGEVPD
jgi:SAM-dependent methyltransferase